jgi:tetratricopeptide (TPR) repeat protein
MKLSTVTLMTLAAVAAQESYTEATPTPNTKFSEGSQTPSETQFSEDIRDQVAVAPTLSMSLPQRLSTPEFTFGDARLSGNSTQIAQLNTSLLNNNEDSILTWLNVLLILAVLVPPITLLFFWLVRRFVIRELMGEMNQRLSRVQHLERQLNTTRDEFYQMLETVGNQFEEMRYAIDFLKEETTHSNASIQKLDRLQQRFAEQIQSIVTRLEQIQTESEVRPTLHDNVGVQRLQKVPQPPQTTDSEFFKSIFPEEALSSLEYKTVKAVPTPQQSRLIADDYLKRGEALVSQKRYSEALVAFKKATLMNPQFSEAWYQQGNTLARLKQYTEAVEAYDQAIELQPDKYETWYNRGNVLVRIKDYETALESFDKALEIQPDDYEAWHNRGTLLRKFNRYQEALAAYDRALLLRPNQYETWQNRGNLLGKLLQYEEAIKSYDQAIRVNAGKYEAWAHRAAALCNLKQYEEALNSYDQAIALDANSASLWSHRGLVLAKLTRYSDALESYETAIQTQADYDEAWLGKGRVLGILKQYSTALEAYDQAIALNPDSAEAWRYRGITLEKLERSGEAVASYDKAISINPKDAEAWRYRGALLSKLKQYQEAISSLGKAIAIQQELRTEKMQVNPPQTVTDDSLTSSV